LSLSYRRNDAD